MTTACSSRAEGPPPIIDAHAHVGSGFAPWRGGVDAADDLAATARDCGIDRVLVSCLGRDGLLEHPSPAELTEANLIARRAVSEHPELAGLVYVSPDHPRASLDEIERHIVDGPFVGLKLWIARKATDPDVGPLVERAAALGVPVLQHTWDKFVDGFPGESGAADIAELARRHPGAILQAAHLVGLGRRGVDTVAPYPNLLVDSSGGDAVEGQVEYAVRTLGADRVVFGTDAPLRDVHAALAKITRAAIDDAAAALVLGGNAARHYRRLAQGGQVRR